MKLYVQSVSSTNTVYQYKIINDETKCYIKEMLGMTQVEKMLMDEADTKVYKKNSQKYVKTWRFTGRHCRSFRSSDRNRQSMGKEILCGSVVE